MVSMATAFVQRRRAAFYAMRFVLGLAEAGFYPGILLYFTYWFPAATRARIIALFCMGIPVSNIHGLAAVQMAARSWKPAACMAGSGCISWKAFPPCCWALSALVGPAGSIPAKANWLSQREKDSRPGAAGCRSQGRRCTAWAR